MILKKKEISNIQIEELGLWIKIIDLDYFYDNNEQLARLITKHSGMRCNRYDIEKYEQLWYEDLELENRKHEYNMISNEKIYI